MKLQFQHHWTIIIAIKMVDSIRLQYHRWIHSKIVLKWPTMIHHRKDLEKVQTGKLGKSGRSFPFGVNLLLKHSWVIIRFFNGPKSRFLVFKEPALKPHSDFLRIRLIKSWLKSPKNKYNQQFKYNQFHQSCGFIAWILQCQWLLGYHKFYDF